MDGSRFDGITRALASETSRRHALLGTAGAAIAGLLGLAGSEDAAAGCVKPGKKGCKGPKNGKCCSGSRCQGGNKQKEGKCQCKGSLKQCGTKCLNVKKDNKNCGGCNKRCTGGNTCTNGKCSSQLGCKKGQNICNVLSEDSFCNEEQSCACFTDLNGTAFCSDLAVFECSTCTSNADCGAGNACADGRGFICECDTADPLVSNGNLCVSATCNGVSSASAIKERLAAIRRR